MQVKFFNIEWDTEGEQVDLPNEVVRTVEDDLDVAMDGADALSDEFGWCIRSFEFEIIN